MSASGRVGMVGAGQLARMTQRAAIDLGVHLTVLATGPDEPAVSAGALHRLGAADDPAALRALASDVDVITLDHELVDTATLASIAAQGVPVRPSARALRVAQDKLVARETFAALGLPGPAHVVASDADGVDELAAAHGWPLVAKARTGGYDGRGVELVADHAALDAVLARGGEWIVEQRIPIALEIAVLVARRPGARASSTRWSRRCSATGSATSWSCRPASARRSRTGRSRSRTPSRTASTPSASSPSSSS